MGKKDTGILSYISGWKFDENDGIKIQVINDENIELSHTKRFHNSLYLLAGLSPCARNLMDWLGEEMNDKNIVYHTEDSRIAFNDFIALITNDKVKYADQTIKQAWGELSSSGLIIKQSSRSAFLVHPKYFFNGEKKKRIDRIVAKLIFDNNGVDNFKIITNKKLGL
jgi:hypothetical protein